jgi:hypothetical protein
MKAPHPQSLLDTQLYARNDADTRALSQHDGGISSLPFALSITRARSDCDVDCRRLFWLTSTTLWHACLRAAMTEANTMLPFWQRLLATIIAMVVASFLAGLAWQAVFNLPLPSYVAGMVGGLAALPTWDFLKRIRPSKP